MSSILTGVRQKLLQVSFWGLLVFQWDFAFSAPLCSQYLGFQLKHRILYQPVIWLPDSMEDRGLYEYRYTTYDPLTGRQEERLRFRTDPEEWEKPYQFNPSQITGRSFPYSYRDPKSGILRQESLEYLGPPPDRSPFPQDKDLFYQAPLDTSSSLSGIFPPRKIPTPSQLTDSVWVKKDGIANPSRREYDHYPEVSLQGIVSERSAGPNDKLELYPLDGSKVLRIRTRQMGEMVHEVFDVVVSSGSLVPGLWLRLKEFVPPRLHEELKIVLKKVSEDRIHGVDKVLERLLFHSGWNMELVKKIEMELRAEGQARKRAFLNEVLEFTNPLYVKRRNWDPKKIDDFSANAFATLDSTRYVKIKNKDGKTVAVLGATMVTYGVVKFYDKVSNSYVEMIGPFGSAYMVAKTGRPIDPDKIPPPGLWQHPVEVLPMESEGFQLMRPSVPEGSPGISAQELKYRLLWDSHLRKLGYEIDLDKPIYFSTGRMIEPVKFGVAKNLGDLGATNVDVLTQVLLSVFPREFSTKFNREGQLLVTYNTLEGARMYRLLGFQQIDYLAPKITYGENGEKIMWYPLGATPATVLEAIRKVKYMRSEEAQEILDFLNNNIKDSTKK